MNFFSQKKNKRGGFKIKYDNNWREKKKRLEFDQMCREYKNIF